MAKYSITLLKSLPQAKATPRSAKARWYLGWLLLQNLARIPGFLSDL